MVDVDLVALKTANAARWAIAKPTRNFVAIARALVAPSAKARYLNVAAKTGVPWHFIAVVHEREASQSWRASLAQGDPWDKVSIHVPAGRGPFQSWEEAAVDALVNCAPHAARNSDWSPGGLLTMLEEYNGLGYAGRGLPSPYLWSGTDQYRAGKYIRDGVFSADVVDTQLGCAGLLMAMMVQDKSIDLARPVIMAPAPDLVGRPIAKPAPGAFASFLQAFLSLFKRG